MFPTLKYGDCEAKCSQQAPNYDEVAFPHLKDHEEGHSWISLDRDGVFRSWAFLNDTVLDAARATKDQIAALIARQRGIVPEHIIEMEEETLANLNDLDIPDEQLFHPPPEVWPVEWLAEAKAGPKDLGETPVDETAPFRSADLWCPPLYCVFEGSIKCLKLWPACVKCFGGICSGRSIDGEDVET
ncbi:hypothetical protein MGN70_011033 [Eutypa lata]|nr:hypothetical protein MGN70_011033 [Eutypa lata]